MNVKGFIPSEVGDAYSYQEALGWLRTVIDHHLVEARTLRLTSIHLIRVGSLWEFSYVMEERATAQYAGQGERRWGLRIANTGARGSGLPTGAKATRIKAKAVISDGS